MVVEQAIAAFEVFPALLSIVNNYNAGKIFSSRTPTPCKQRVFPDRNGHTKGQCCYNAGFQTQIAPRAKFELIE